MIVKKANSYDAINIAKLHYELWNDFYKNMVSDDFLKKVSLDKRKKYWMRYISDNNIVYVIEEKTGDTVGFIVPIVHKRKNGEYVGEIVAHYVSNIHQNKGYGKKLLQVCAKFFDKNNVNSMFVWVQRENKAAEFYKKMYGEEVDARIDKVDTKNIVKLKFEWNDLKKVSI